MRKIGVIPNFMAATYLSSGGIPSAVSTNNNVVDHSNSSSSSHLGSHNGASGGLSGNQSSSGTPTGGGGAGGAGGGLTPTQEEVLASSGVMNLAAAYGAPLRGQHGLAAEMHEMKYLPHHHHQQSLHNGHHHAAAAAVHGHHLGAHNPWASVGVGMSPHEAAWAMHPAHSLYAQDIKQDIKPHSPGDFHQSLASPNQPNGGGSTTSVPNSALSPRSSSASSTPSHAHSAAAMAVAAATGHHPSSWNPPPPVSSPYLGMSASNSSTGGTGHGGNSPSPLSHPAHPAYGGMNGVLPGQMHHHPFVDRYHRESHNSSPRSGTDEDGMQTPTSGRDLIHLPQWVLFLLKDDW